MASSRSTAVSSSASAPPVTDSSEDLGDVALLPGLVNAHTHLELSWMRGRVPPSASMPAWAAALIALRQTTAADAKEAIAAAIGEARGSGSCAFGDITNSLASFEPLAAAGVFARVFQELLGFSPQDPAPIVDRAIERAAALPQTARLKLALAPHAPYLGVAGAVRRDRRARQAGSAAAGRGPPAARPSTAALSGGESPACRLSPIMRGQRSVMSRREALILQSLINHPWLLHDHLEEVAALELAHPEAHKLRAGIIAAFASDHHHYARARRTSEKMRADLAAERIFASSSKG